MGQAPSGELYLERYSLRASKATAQPSEVSYLVYTFRQPQPGNSGSIINKAGKTGLGV